LKLYISRFLFSVINFKYFIMWFNINSSWMSVSVEFQFCYFILVLWLLFIFVCLADMITWVIWLRMRDSASAKNFRHHNNLQRDSQNSLMQLLDKISTVWSMIIFINASVNHKHSHIISINSETNCIKVFFLELLTECFYQQ